MIKIPYNCIECDYIKDDTTCGIYNDQIFVINLNREPAEYCPLRQLNRFNWLVNNCIKEVIQYPDKNTTVFSYKIEMYLDVNNSVVDTIDNKMG